MMLWSAAEAAAATGGDKTTNWHAEGVSIDTRTLAPGDLFVALKDVRDGHDFVADALAKGAAAAMVSHRPENVAATAPLLVVPDVLRALEDLGRAARARTKARVVAITGSAGKTTTKEMLAGMLGAQGKTHASAASYNNHWGVPLTLARMPADTDYAVIEIGMNHPGEIAPLSKLARPHVAVITTVAAAHLEAFANVEEIAVEKASILEGVEPGGVAILNNDVEQAAILAAKALDCKLRDIGFGEHGLDYVLGNVRIAGDTSVVQARAGETELMFRLATPGRHFAMNALGALAACEALGADLALATHALGRWRPFKGRGTREVIRLDDVDESLSLELLDDSYNANPASMAASLAVLAAIDVRHGTGRIKLGRRIAILGDMKELGPTGPKRHADLAQLPAMSNIDVIHCVGPLMKSLHEVLPREQQGRWFETSADMAALVPRLLDSGDVVLVKGSLSMDLARVVDAIRKMGDGSLSETAKGADDNA
ncbi:MAG: UDP-N-acetylmuramoyl-tripeptide--D-alanyl-D-alanine ligase [Arenibacterium sp.]